MKAFLNNLIKDDRGASAMEYGLICAMIVIAMVSALQGVADEINNTWTTITDKSTNAISQASGS